MLKIQKALYTALIAETREAAEKIVICEMWEDYGTAKQWRVYFDECSTWAIAVRDMSRNEFVTFVAWNEDVREYLGL